MTELGRKLHTWQEQMERHRATMENALYAAEQLCHDAHNGKPQCPLGSDCPFHAAFKPNRPFGCEISGIRQTIGDHIQQHDAMPGVPPCHERKIK